MLKETLLFVGGAVTGAAICYFVTKKKYETEISYLESEIDATIDKYYASQEEQIPETEELNEEERKEVETYNSLAGNYTDYSRITKPDISTLMHEKHPEYDFKILDPNNPDPEEQLYEQQTVQYYEEDGTLADISENIIPDLENVIGPDALDHFGEYGEEDIVRVRNKKLGIDYEVIRIHGSYVDFN